MSRRSSDSCLKLAGIKLEAGQVLLATARIIQGQERASGLAFTGGAQRRQLARFAPDCPGRAAERAAGPQ